MEEIVTEINVGQVAQALILTGDLIITTFCPLLGITEEELEEMNLSPGALWNQVMQQIAALTESDD